MKHKIMLTCCVPSYTHNFLFSSFYLLSARYHTTKNSGKSADDDHGKSNQLSQLNETFQFFTPIQNFSWFVLCQDNLWATYSTAPAYVFCELNRKSDVLFFHFDSLDFSYAVIMFNWNDSTGISLRTGSVMAIDQAQLIKI